MNLLFFRCPHFNCRECQRQHQLPIFRSFFVHSWCICIFSPNGNSQHDWTNRGFIYWKSSKLNWNCKERSCQEKCFTLRSIWVGVEQRGYQKCKFLLYPLFLVVGCNSALILRHLLQDSLPTSTFPQSKYRKFIDKVQEQHVQKVSSSVQRQEFSLVPKDQIKQLFSGFSLHFSLVHTLILFLLLVFISQIHFFCLHSH